MRAIRNKGRVYNNSLVSHEGLAHYLAIYGISFTSVDPNRNVQHLSFLHWPHGLAVLSQDFPSAAI